METLPVLMIERERHLVMSRASATFTMPASIVRQRLLELWPIMACRVSPIMIMRCASG
ncbi:hypothetical protein D3C80_2210280 [compost metagenome]